MNVMRHLRDYPPERLDKTTLRCLRDILKAEVEAWDEIRDDIDSPEALEEWDRVFKEEDDAKAAMLARLERLLQVH